MLGLQWHYQVMVQMSSFGGYNRHRLAPKLNRLFGDMPSFLRRGISRSLANVPIPDYGLSRDKRRSLHLLSCSSSLKLFMSL